MTAGKLAFDFGTSNSALAICQQGTSHRIEVELQHDTLPTAVFFPEDGGDMRVGRAAHRALIDGEDGRYMRALKSILGTPLFHQARLIEGRRRTLADIVTAFIAQTKARAEARTGMKFQQVLSGRPVRFHNLDDDRDTRAENDLRDCYHEAGFRQVEFMLEPEAAALAARRHGATDETGIVVDIGGGTSDFSVYRASDNRFDILASHGIRLGGTDFDQRLSVTHVMPLLGKGGQLRRAFGDGLLPVPNAIYEDLATWPKIPFLYTRETLRAVQEMQALAVEPLGLTRLAHVIEDELGHGLAFAVEAGKIAANASGAAVIDLSEVEAGLSSPVTTASMAEALDRQSAQLSQAIGETLKRAGVTPEQIDTAVLVGGSSLMQTVRQAVQTALPHAALRQEEAFTAVIDGLALALPFPKGP